MNTKRREKFHELRLHIGNLAIYSENIEYTIDELICNNLVSNKYKRGIFINTILRSGRFNIEDKIYCLRLISETITNSSMRNRIDLMLRFAYRFNNIKSKLFKGKLYFPEGVDSIVKKNVADNHTYESIEVTDEYIRKLKSDMSDIAFTYRKVREYFDGTT